jgi:hypothetical protein
MQEYVGISICGTGVWVPYLNWIHGKIHIDVSVTLVFLFGADGE